MPPSQELRRHRATRNANRLGRTPDLFANTSLEEERNTGVARPAPRTMPRYTPEELAAIEQHYNAVNEYVDWVEERAREQREDKPLEDRANAIDDQRREHHLQEQPLLSTFTSAVQQWQQDRPDEAAKFVEHFREVNMASTEPVRVYDMVSWYPGTPPPVADAIKALQGFYHRQVSFDYDIQRLEEQLARDAWPMHDLHPEVYHASRRDRAAKRDGRDFQTFGFGLKHHDLAKFEETLEKLIDVDEPGLEARRVLNVRANFRVRRILLEGTGPGANHPDGRRPRYDPSGVTKFRDTVDWDLFQWALHAIFVMGHELIPAYAGKVHPGVVNLLNSTLIEITDYLPTIDVIGVRDMKRTIQTTYRNSFDQLEQHLANMQQNGADTAAQEQLADMKDQIYGLVITFDRFETKHGRGILGQQWRDLRLENRQLLQGPSPSAPWTDSDDAEYLERSGHPDDGWAESEDEDEGSMDEPQD
ncbi:hypothetical protein BST61_g10313 [Cercospora zeina]